MKLGARVNCVISMYGKRTLLRNAVNILLVMCLVVIKMDYVNFRENFERMISTSLGFQNYKTYIIISPQKKNLFCKFQKHYKFFR